MPRGTPISRRVQVVLAFALVYVFWGSTYLGIRVAVERIPPILMAGLRFSIAGALMLVFCRLRGRRTQLTLDQFWRLAFIGIRGPSCAATRQNGDPRWPTSPAWTWTRET